MDFNVKKLASGAGVFFTRAVQFTEEKFGQAEKTELDAHFENLLSRADCTKLWTEKIYRQTEALLQPNPIDHTGARIEEFLYEKLDRKVPSRITNGELLGQYMQDAAKEFGPGTPYGSTLIEVGECERRLGAAEREFLQTSAISFLTPLRNFLEGDWRTISKERRLLENLRLDLDACKTRLKKAKVAEAKAGMAPDFQETRPRNYVLSASASAAEHELRVAQTEFDRQAEVTRLLLEGISSTHVNHLRCLHEFVEAQAAYHKQCHFHMQELQKELGRLPNAFALNATHTIATTGSATEGLSSPVETDTLKIEEVQAPATGTRKAKVLYDYDAADSSELSLLADEDTNPSLLSESPACTLLLFLTPGRLITVYTVPGMDSDWLIGERGNQKGKVPVTYLELLS
ncbi:endophilin-B2-like isoform X6 [Cyclopterus lumpus]|uniref:endophilin-B2-like isoform X6 n=1 Tax=Cyclopterus lumpus TaxID=8103 RepID=UPI00148736E0|nr:endophilin-B2-like isoform X6 [Cyclopterus lumpus]